MKNSRESNVNVGDKIALATPTSGELRCVRQRAAKARLQATGGGNNRLEVEVNANMGVGLTNGSAGAHIKLNQMGI